MKINKYLVFLFLGVLGIILFGIIQFFVVVYHNQQQVNAGNALRCHVFTYLIKPGMTRNEVEDVLDLYGLYTVGQADFSGGVFSLQISFTDSETRRRFGSDIILWFEKDQFVSAVLPYGIGESRPVCEK